MVDHSASGDTDRHGLARAGPTSSEILDGPAQGGVDLGLVYEAVARDGDVHVVMTMTTAACPLGESMADEAATVIRSRVRGVKSVSVRLVWEPAWRASMTSAVAREQLGWK